MNEARSTLIYDGDCSFCIRCVDRLKKITKGKVECLSFQSYRERFQEILIGEPTPDYRTTTNLVTIKVVYSIESTDDVNILTLTTEQSTI